jgi:hypothetical protein
LKCPAPRVDANSTRTRTVSQPSRHATTAQNGSYA